KAELIKEKKIKKSKSLPKITDDEKPFDIPDSWEWVRLDEINTYNGKSVHPDKEPTKNFELYSVPIYETRQPEITVGKEIRSNKQTVEPEDVLLCKINPRINRVWKVGNFTQYETIASTEWIVVRQKEIIPEYLRYALMSPYFRKLLQSNVSGVGGSLTRAKPVLVRKYPFPLPPLSEQSRIAAKIAELFALLHKVESSTQQYAKLQTLLKSKVLDLAMRGKLVEQDPIDEPASVLLEKIKAEKEQLIKEKKIKRSKPLPPITDEEKPFEIPDSWEWVRLGEVLTILRGGSPRPIKKYLTDSPNGINWIKIGDSTVNSKYIDHAAEKIIPEGLDKTREVHKGDFLLSNSMSFGRPYILKIDGAVHDGWLILSDYDKLFDKNYLYYLLSSNFVNFQFKSLATGSTVKNLNRDRVAHTIALVPPLLEQKRIIKKINYLLTKLNIKLY
ncbi:restriction endonuclease subunit S, partial [Lactobacillus intestinalis]|uniref:restriction endonuclease subunit S n=1 Tax=Lactobacillus intestinalis TaxID=151781 RepID=UPI0025A531A1